MRQDKVTHSVPQKEQDQLPKTIIVTGSREYHKGWFVSDILTSQFRALNGKIFVKVGDCPTGVDKHTLSWCETILPEDQYKVYYADWNKFGKTAGPRRNHEMCDSGGDLCIALPDENSKGTKDCAEYANRIGIPVWFPELPSWAQWAAPIAQWR